MNAVHIIHSYMAHRRLLRLYYSVSTSLSVSGAAVLDTPQHVISFSHLGVCIANSKSRVCYAFWWPMGTGCVTRHLQGVVSGVLS
jgi:hypothetical protein